MEIISLRAKAQEEMGGSSSRVGFFGDPEWVIGGAIAAGLVGALISNSKTKKGLEFLKEAALRHEKLKSMGKLIDISLIEGIDRPIPARWRGVKSTEKRYFSSGGFVIPEDEFVWVESDEKIIAVRWSMVESYEFINLSAQKYSELMSEHEISFDGEFYKHKEINFKNLVDAVDSAKKFNLY